MARSRLRIGADPEQCGKLHDRDYGRQIEFGAADRRELDVAEH
ncbi:hypothetical protein [Bradyrhizobium sp. 45]|nr:hypothetical protein [Bradyrhizobium sp. 45]